MTDTGFGTGAPGFSAHRIFVNQENVTRLDGDSFDPASLVRQAARGTCEICGAWCISTDWPTAPWRHATANEAEAIELSLTISAAGKGGES